MNDSPTFGRACFGLARALLCYLKDLARLSVRRLSVR